MSDYIPYGLEWKKEMMRWRKADIIEFLRKQLIGGAVKGENTGGAISLIIRLPLDVTYIQKIEKAVGISLGKLGFTQTTTSKDDTTTINYKQFITEVEG